MNYYHAFTTKFDVDNVAYIVEDNKLEKVEITAVNFKSTSSGTSNYEITYDLNLLETDSWYDFRREIKEEDIFPDKLAFIQSIIPDVESVVYKNTQPVTTYGGTIAYTEFNV